MLIMIAPDELRAAIRRAGLTHVEFAKRLDMSRAGVSAWMSKGSRGITDPGREAQVRDVLGMVDSPGNALSAMSDVSLLAGIAAYTAELMRRAAGRTDERRHLPGPKIDAS